MEALREAQKRASHRANEILRTANRPPEENGDAASPSARRRFTVVRKMAAEAENEELSRTVASWLASETGRPVRGETIVEDLESGVVLNVLLSKFGVVTRFKDPPANEFQRIQNFTLLANGLKQLGVSSAPPPSRRGGTLKEILPVVFELAQRASESAFLSVAPLSTPDETKERNGDAAPSTTTTSTETSAGKPSNSVYDADDEEEENEEEDADEEEQNSTKDLGGEKQELDLGELHRLRIERQKKAPPKLRIVRVGAKELIVIERPGEHVGSILWEGAIVLVEFLSRNADHLFPPEFVNPSLSQFSTSSVKNRAEGAKFVELGAGLGLVGIYCACRGADVVVTDLSPNLDLLFGNVAANAQTIVKSGGACSARELDFKELATSDRLFSQLASTGTSSSPLPDAAASPRTLVLLASDVVYNDSVVPFARTVEHIFKTYDGRNGVEVIMYMSYKERDPANEARFFEIIAQDLSLSWESAPGEGSYRVMYLFRRVKR